MKGPEYDVIINSSNLNSVLNDGLNFSFVGIQKSSKNPTEVLDINKGFIEFKQFNESDNLTITAWIKFRQSVKSSVILFFGTENEYLTVLLDENSIVNLITNHNSVKTSITIQSNTWHHISLVMKNSIAIIYLNGISKGSISISSNLVKNSVTIGKSLENMYNNSEFLSAYIEEIKFKYNAFKSVELIMDYILTKESNN